MKEKLANGEKLKQDYVHKALKKNNSIEQIVLPAVKKVFVLHVIIASNKRSLIFLDVKTAFLQGRFMYTLKMKPKPTRYGNLEKVFTDLPTQVYTGI